MTTVAVNVRELEIVIRVARGTRHRHMGSGQRECRGSVIEAGLVPAGGAVACLAVMTEVAADMARIGRLLICRTVALIAIGIDQLVVAICVTVLTDRLDVCPSQRETSCAVIERGIRPVDGAVTLRTVVAVLAAHMVRIGCPLIISLMACVAAAIDNPIIARCVAGLTGGLKMRTGQWEMRCRVIKGCRQPCLGGVARLAIPTELGRNMIGVGRPLVI